MSSNDISINSVLSRILLINYNEDAKKYTKINNDLRNKLLPKHYGDYDIIIVCTQNSLSINPMYNPPHLQHQLKKIFLENGYEMLYKIDATRKKDTSLGIRTEPHNVRTRIYINNKVQILFDKNRFKKSYSNKNSYTNLRTTTLRNNNRNPSKIVIHSLHTYRQTNTNKSVNGGKYGSGIIYTNLNLLVKNKIQPIIIVNDNFHLNRRIQLKITNINNSSEEKVIPINEVNINADEFIRKKVKLNEIQNKNKNIQEVKIFKSKNQKKIFKPLVNFNNNSIKNISQKNVNNILKETPDIQSKVVKYLTNTIDINEIEGKKNVFKKLLSLKNGIDNLPPYSQTRSKIQMLGSKIVIKNNNYFTEKNKESWNSSFSTRIGIFEK